MKIQPGDHHYKVRERGLYDSFKGISYPEKPLNEENAHFTLKINGIKAGDFYLDTSEKTINYKVVNDQEIQLEIIYDNDLFLEGKDRNAIIKTIDIVKK